MNMSQVHLALTHIPVVLSLAGLVVLLISLFSKNSTISKVGFSILAIAGISALPVFFSGHEAEEAVEHLPGVSESLIERHEEVAKFALISILVAGTIALAGLIRIAHRQLQKESGLPCCFYPLYLQASWRKQHTWVDKSGIQRSGKVQ
jgi:uncharacterized membrane protein